jgi:hypothetical protein
MPAALSLLWRLNSTKRHDLLAIRKGMRPTA